jgi:quercetin dioxygenase-like cupin family protein
MALALVDLEIAHGEDKQQAWSTDHLQIMRIRLAPGEALPHHRANSSALLLPLAGAVQVTTEEQSEVAAPGQAVAVDYQTPMDVSNAVDEATVFLVIKAPHPASLAD